MCVRAYVTRKEGGAKSHLHVGPSALGLTHQDGNHDADVLGVLPEHAAMGHFCKMCQSAKEHQKAQHLEHRSDLRGEKGQVRASKSRVSPLHGDNDAQAGVQAKEIQAESV